MVNKVKINDGSRVVIKWNVLPMDYSREKEHEIISKMSNKYGISKENIKVEPYFISKNENNEIVPYSNDIINNINDIAFQRQLFKEYIKERGIENCEFEKLVEIDNVINSLVDYDKYEKHRKYTIKWIKWSNFMSYGPDNFVDFSNFKGLTLLTSTPSNQGGKSTFCVDLVRFLLFGKVTSRESDWTLSKVFNKHLPEATEVSVEGCIMIDGEDYIIKRVVSRPSLNKRTNKSKVTQKINYYKIINNEYFDLIDEENQQGISNVRTNQIIKEAIGNERDFDMMICVNSDNLKGLISLKETERGRLLSRWIGLLPLEEKDKIARDYFNKNVTPKLLINKYNKEDVKNEINELSKEDEEIRVTLNKLQHEVVKIKENINRLNIERDSLLQSKQEVDKTLMNVDVKTIERQIKSITDSGIIKKEEKAKNEERLKEIGSIEFDENEYQNIIEREKKVSIEHNTSTIERKRLIEEINKLEKSEFCPTCGAKLKNVDNSAIIASKKELLKNVANKIELKEKELEDIKVTRINLDEKRKLYSEKQRLELIISKNNVDIENLRLEYKNKKRILTDIENNKGIIENNNRIDNALNIVNVNIKNEEGILNSRNQAILTCEKNKEVITKTITQNEKIVEIITKEEILLYHWRIYLDIIGKNGITKIVLKNTLPLINGELSQLLNGVCDFNVEVDVDEKQDVSFYLIHDDVKSNLSSGSGFEQTVSSLALRSVLSRISTFSKPSVVIFDEILGGVSDENYDNVKSLYDKIAKDYDTILQITHLKAIHDWHNNSILISKKNNISTITVQ